MGERGSKVAVFGLVALVCAFAFYVARSRPGLVTNQSYLGGLIFLQLLIAAVWKFRQVFFLFLMGAFLWAGMDLPFSETWTSARWVVLAAGAVAGYVVFMKDRGHRLGVFHLLAFFSVLAAFVSALESAYPATACLKAASLFLLFLYASSGGRLAILGREASFFRGLLLSSEIIVYLTAFVYLGLHLQSWGNPNSLGLVMGVVLGPLLLWGALISETRAIRQRRAVAFGLAMVLLFFSVSRASIIGGLFSMSLLCLTLHRQKLLLQGVVIGLFLIGTLAVLDPAKLQELTSSSTSALLYKGHEENGAWASRKSPWQQTMKVISEHPWFGGGFGTSASRQENAEVGRFASSTSTTREHGSSYLALLEWVGMLGIVPFVALLALLVAKIVRALAWMHRTGNANHIVVPIVTVLVGGLVHALLEDWLFAVGYYFTIFFWTFAFVFVDLVPASAPAVSQVAWRTSPKPHGFGTVATGR